MVQEQTAAYFDEKQELSVDRKSSVYTQNWEEPNDVALRLKEADLDDGESTDQLKLSIMRTKQSGTPQANSGSNSSRRTVKTLNTPLNGQFNDNDAGDSDQFSANIRNEEEDATEHHMSLDDNSDQDDAEKLDDSDYSTSYPNLT